MEEIICKKCGTHSVAGESFCGGCGAFLEWEGERVVVEAPPSALPPPPPGRLPPGTPPPPSIAAGGGQPVAPPPVAAPVAVQPALAPDRPKLPPQRVIPVRRPQPGDIICGECGEPNGSERRFCRRCGKFLAEPVGPPPRLRWWRRIFHRHQPGPQQDGAPTAGSANGGTSTEAPHGAPPRPPGGAPAPPRPPGAPPAPPRPPGAVAAPPRPAYPPPAARPVPLARSMPYGAKPPAGLRKTHKLRGGVLIVALVAVIVCAVDPPLRQRITNEANRIRYDIVPSYQKVPLQSANATGYGSCTPALLSGNDTVYWYTRAVIDGPEDLTIAVAPGFTGTITRIAFTPLVANASAAPSGQASPNPEEIILRSTPPSPPGTITLDNPPKFDQATVKVISPSVIRLQLVSTDPGAAPTTCAETGLVLYESKD